MRRTPISLLWVLLLAVPSHSATLRLGVDAPNLAAALASARDGDVVVVPPGRWKGGVRIEQSITLRGAGGAVDGHGKGSTLVLAAPGIRIEHLAIQGSGHDVGRSDSCVYLEPSATDAVVTHNQLTDCAFGIWVHRTTGAEISDNHVVGRESLRPTDRGDHASTPAVAATVSLHCSVCSIITRKYLVN